VTERFAPGSLGAAAGPMAILAGFRLAETAQFVVTASPAVGHRADADPRRHARRVRRAGSTRLRPLGLAACALAAVALAEYLTTYSDPTYGVLLHVALLFGFLTAGAYASDTRVQAFFLALTAAPLIRIVSLGMPLGEVPQPFWYVLTGTPLFFAVFLTARSLGIGRRALSLTLPWRTIPFQLLVALSGAVLGIVEYQILRPVPMVGVSSLPVLAGAAGILIVFTGFMEELVFRGLVQGVAGRWLGAKTGVLVASALFAILHTGWRSPVDMLFVFGVALYFGTVVRLTGSLFGVSLAHGAINIVLFIALPLLLTPQLAPRVFQPTAPPPLAPAVSGDKAHGGFLWTQPVELQWAGPSRAKYQLQVTYVSGFRPRPDVGYTLSRSMRATALEFRVLRPGTYTWRIRERYLGTWLPYTPAQRFRIVR